MIQLSALGVAAADGYAVSLAFTPTAGTVLGVIFGLVSIFWMQPWQVEVEEHRTSG